MRCRRRRSTIEPALRDSHNLVRLAPAALASPDFLRGGTQYSSAEEAQRPELVPHGRIWVSPRLDAALTAVDNEARRQGGQITWVSGWRSRAQQANLFRLWEAGDPGVPLEPLPYEESKHATGEAADGEASSPQLAAHLGAYAPNVGLRWSPVEPWHFELRPRAAEVGR